jgi:hypothetical protein
MSDHRAAALAKVHELAELLKSQGSSASLVEETESLERAISAFHMEGIRFRIYNVDRLLKHGAQAPPDASRILEDARRHLEAAGFHTRSHQAPG